MVVGARALHGEYREEGRICAHVCVCVWFFKRTIYLLFSG